ncbi:hypothetical protein L228DRAFT_162961 [Xylona heveae TC161]|uniref:RRM domain-containing protein n=1 Tax=Xylona heveae (strain CBS 132557 / TC161) TaxID=1328760 RepID=A0A165G9T6_XYLHT|nr:hypothetical protein L228DRAFT_162961 [Xylona heveae TC161]KZF21919.1 hypothetical protein L228DRAFT_162961 [Xylona heveae TC161]
MTSTPPPEAPAFRGKTLSPVSPRPVHLPEPSNIPILEYQMDPDFNTTASHLVASQTNPAAAITVQNQPIGASNASQSVAAHAEPPVQAQAELEQGVDQKGPSPEGSGVEDGTDDYAMSLDNDDEDGSDNQTSPPSITAPPANSTSLSINTGAAAPTSAPVIPTAAPQDASAAGASAPETFEPLQTDRVPVSVSELPSDMGTYLSSALNASAGSTAQPPTFSDALAPSAALNEAAKASVPMPAGDRTGVSFGEGEHGGGVNYQTLLENLSPPLTVNAAPGAETLTAATTASPTTASTVPRPASAAKSPTAVLAPPANLPPRPPPQEKPNTHPNYAPGDDIRSYHPHTQASPTAPFPPQTSTSYRPSQGGLASLVAAGAPGTSSVANGLPPPPLATFQQSALPAQPQQQSPSSAQSYRSKDKSERGLGRSSDDDSEVPWGPEIQKKYDEFLHDERVYVTEGQWDRFPPNSRMFIGNLPTEKVTKRDLFHIFHKHGRLAQISIKQAYGFVQFLEAGSCYRALQAEQGMSVRGRKMHLEISKPQKNTRSSTDSGRQSSRRSRSPDYTRGGDSYRGGRDRVDRAFDARNRDFPRGRDDYRPMRSPSPRGFRGGRDEYRSGRDHYDGRRRSRSRSPFGRGGPRYRSRSPRGREAPADELPFPRRAPKDVPDVQLILSDELDRNFIAFVERSFTDRALRVDVLFLSSRISEEAVFRRQILEGVQAISKLTRASQATGRISLQIFDRRGGADNVRFDEYDNLDPHICAELVVRAKQTHGAPPLQTAPYGVPAPAFSTPPYSQTLPPPVAAAVPPAIQPVTAAPHAAGTPNLANLITSLDGPTLQKLLGVIQNSPQTPQQPPMTPIPAPPTPASATSMTTDLASLLSGAARQAPAPQPVAAPPPQPPQVNPYAALATNPALASLLTGAAANAQAASQQQSPILQQPQMQQPTNQVQSIMEQLTKWKQ